MNDLYDTLEAKLNRKQIPKGLEISQKNDENINLIQDELLTFDNKELIDSNFKKMRESNKQLTDEIYYLIDFSNSNNFESIKKRLAATKDYFEEFYQNYNAYLSESIEKFDSTISKTNKLLQ
jgi:hypothetical protein